MLDNLGPSSGASELPAGGRGLVVDLPVGFAIAPLLSKETVGGWAASITEGSSSRRDYEGARNVGEGALRALG